MDPLSLPASIIAIIGTASVLIKIIRNIEDAPSELIEISNATKALENALDDVRRWHLTGHALNEGLAFHIQRSEHKLLELTSYLKEHGLCSSNRLRYSISFIRYQDKLRLYRDQLSEIRNDLTLALSAETYGQSGRIEMDLQQLVLSRRITQEVLVEHMTRIDHLAQTTEEMRMAQVQMARLLEAVKEQGGNKQSGSVTNQDSSLVRLRHSIQMENKFQHPAQGGLDFPHSMTMKPDDRSRRSSQCTGACRCSCHKRRRICAPQATRDWVGSLSVTFGGINTLSPSCTVPSCVRNLRPSVTVDMTLPSWLASHMISIWLKAAPIQGPELLLRSRRIIETPAYYTAEQGNITSLRRLYSEGRAGIHDVNPLSGRNTLFDSIFRGHLDMVQFLLGNGADMEAADFCGFTPRDLAFQRVHTACAPAMAESLRVLFRLDEIPDELEFTVVHRIVMGLSPLDLDGYLSEHPQEINTADLLGRTPLWWAVRRDDLEQSLCLLHHHGADANMANAAGRSPLHNAAAQGNLVLVEALLAHGADVGQRSFEGKTPLQVVGVYGVREDVLIVERLLAAGSEIDAQDGYGRTALSLCCFDSHVNIARTLLERRASLRIPDVRGWLPWHWAIYDGASKILELYLGQRDCDLGFVLSGGTTVLHFLAERCTEDKIVNVMLEKADLSNVDPGAKDSLGKTAADILEERQSMAVCERPLTDSIYGNIQQLIGFWTRHRSSGSPPMSARSSSTADSWHTAGSPVGSFKLDSFD